MLPADLRSPAKGGATVFPQATHYRLPEPPRAAGQRPVLTLGQASQSAGGDDAAAVSWRRLQAGSGVLTEDSGGQDLPSYCAEGAGLQVAPPPGSAVLFW